jgi:hypothetical protein
MGIPRSPLQFWHGVYARRHARFEVACAGYHQDLYTSSFNKFRNEHPLNRSFDADDSTVAPGYFLEDCSPCTSAGNIVKYALRPRLDDQNSFAFSNVKASDSAVAKVSPRRLHVRIHFKRLQF